MLEQQKNIIIREKLFYENILRNTISFKVISDINYKLHIILHICKCTVVIYYTDRTKILMKMSKNIVFSHPPNILTVMFLKN